MVKEKRAQREVQSKKRYFFAFLIGTFIFLLGFAITYSISYFEFQRISDFQGVTSYEIFNDKLGYALFNEDICSSKSLKEISADLGFQGRIIDDLERKFGKDNKDVLFRKRFYSLVELEHFEFVNAINKECNRNIPTILFFYSNEAKDAEKSEDAGRLLDAVSRRNEELIIYSFDINLDSELIEKLKDKYGVEKSPTAIINGKNKVVDFQNIKEIERFLDDFDDVDSEDYIIRL